MPPSLYCNAQGQKRYPKELLQQRFRRTFWCDLPQNPCFILGKRKTNKHKHFGRDGVRDKQEPSLGQIGTRPRDKPGPVPGTNRPFPVYFHSKGTILSRLSLGRVGVRPWDDCPTRAVRKMFMCFCLLVFFRPHYLWVMTGNPPRIVQKIVWRCSRLSGLVAGDSAICGRLAALILRLRPAGLRFEEFRSPVKRCGLGLRFSNRSGLRPAAI